jgi:Xaa-Pro dipeptidase
MLNQDRLQGLQDAMQEHAWDLLLLYGHSWRKDFFRCLLNVNFCGPHAVLALTRSGDINVLVSHPWDVEAISGFVNGKVTIAQDFAAGLARIVGPFKAVAIAGMELMEARFVHAVPNPVSATLLLEELRRVKTTYEIDCLTKAAELADRGYQYFAQVIEEGMAEFELVAEVESFLKTNGAEDNFMLIASGGVEVTGMRPPTARRFQKGDSVTTELTPQVNGYFAQICRTLVLGEPNAHQRQAFSIFAEARQAAEDLLAPGVNVSALARAQNDVFRKYGYGEYTGPKHTRVRGHGLGLHPDENPYILEDVDYVVKPGMILIAHPNTYLPLSGYMVFGDTLQVTASGCTSLNRTERKLFQKEAR